MLYLKSVGSITTGERRNLNSLSAVSVGTGYDPHMGVGDINAFGKGLFDFKKIYDGVRQLVDLFGKAVSDVEKI